MKKNEKLAGTAAVKGTMVEAHLEWAASKLGDLGARLTPLLPPDCASYTSHRILATDWIPFKCLIEIDRGIARAVGGGAEAIFRELGRHSASKNLGGVYKSFVPDEPHKFFEQQAMLHHRFRNFGRSSYARVSDRSGRITLDQYAEYSPVFCVSGEGFYAEALKLMKVPGPVSAAETACQCAGDPACVYELSW